MRPAQRREQILDVAEQLFVESGYAAVTMEQIARAAGVTRPVPYNYFDTKESVYLACVRRARSEYDIKLIARIDPDADPRAQLAAGADAFFSILERDRSRWLLLFGSNAVLPGAYNTDLAALRFGTIAAIEALLAAAAPFAPKERITACAHAVSGVGERLGHWWLTEPSLSRQALVEHYTEIVWSGMLPYVEMT